MNRKILYTMLVLLFLTACDDMNSIQQEYVKNGERIYLAKPMDVSVLAGENRVAFDFRIINPNNEKYCVVSDAGGKEIFRIDIDSKADTFKVFRIVDNLNEGAYTFNLQTLDGAGNSSLVVTAYGKAYGEFYKSTIRNATVSGLTDENGKTKVQLSGINSDISGYELKFTRIGEAEETYLRVNDVKKLIWSDDTSFNLDTLIQAGTGFAWRAAYLPEKVVLDTFYTAWTEWSGVIIGSYRSTGTFNHPTQGIRTINRDKSLTAIGSNLFQTEHSDLGGNGYTIRVKRNEDNSLTVTQYLNGLLLANSEMTPGGVNSYNPTTGAFTLSYRYSGSNGYRTITETLIRK